jgi:hypothetical protein
MGIVYKLLAYGYLLNQLGRHCDSHLKVVESGRLISTQVQGLAHHACNLDLSIHVCICVHRCN